MNLIDILNFLAILAIFSIIAVIFARINYSIQEKVNKEYIFFLSGLDNMIAWDTERNRSLKETPNISLKEIRNKVFLKDINLIIKNLKKYEAIMGEPNELIEKIILTLYLGEYPTNEEIITLHMLITKQIGWLERKIKYRKELFLPWNWLNNIMDVLAYKFMDYQLYFLQSKTQRSKAVISDLTAVLGFLILIFKNYYIFKAIINFFF